MNMNSTKLLSFYSRVYTTSGCRCFHQNITQHRSVAKKVDPADPKYFDGKIEDDDSLSADAHEYWWGRNNPLHALNHVRVPFIRDGIFATGIRSVADGGNLSRLDGIKILDVGCGGGILSEALARIGADVTAIDIEKRMIEVARKHHQLDPTISQNLRYDHTSIFKHEKDNNEKYSAVVLSEVIEHVGHKEKLLRSCVNTLQPGGSLFITCPNRTFLSKMFGVKLAEAMNIVPKGTHNYDKFITDEELTKMIKTLNCGIRSIQGIVFNPLTGRFSMTQIKTFMYAIHAQKFVDKRTQISC